MGKLQQLHILQKKIASCSSSKKKIEELENFKNSSIYKDGKEFYDEMFNFIYDKDITFGITSDSVKKFDKDDVKPEIYQGGAKQILKELSLRKITGDTALASVRYMSHFMEDDEREMFFDIIDKDFKCGVNVKTISKVFPIKLPFTEYVALANKYFERVDKVDFNKEEWFYSRKLDGNRLILIKNDDGIICMSRQGKEIHTLDNLKKVIGNVDGNFILDGECCIVDENGDENFQEIMKVITKKNFTIDKPVMKVFDILTEDEFYGNQESPKFEERYSRLIEMFDKYGDMIGNNFNLVKQTKVESKEQLMEAFEFAQNCGWEGLMIRKNIPYECGRTNNLLKIKGFHDDEYVVSGYEMGNMRFVEDGKQVEKEVLASITINHKGYEVKVGSGFSKEQREYLHEHPEEIIGSLVRVKYFEETNNMQGGISLRFPTIVYFYGKNKRFD